MVDIFGKWADVRKAAARPRQSLERFGDGQDLGAELRRLGAQPAPDPTPHGMRIQDLAEMRRNMAAFEPNIAGPGAQAVAKAKLIAEVLPRGASSYPKTAQTTLNTDGGSATTMYHNMRPYQPELEDPSRQMMPQARTQWNKYARLFYKCDAVIPTVVDMLAELSFGEFTLSGDGVEGDIKKDMEASLDACRVQQRLPDMAREYFMLGEAGVHNYFDEEKGYWSYIAIHNPDQLEVIQTPFLPMEPVVEFRPDPTLREILLSQHPMLRELRESLPPEMVAAVIGGRNITLAPNNFTFLARKLHPYEMRGTSILSRLWRILMFEDCYTAGTPVSLADGTTRPIEEICAGDRVLDRHGHEAVVEAAVEKESGGTLRRIALRGGSSFTVTPTHKFPVWAYPRVCQCGCGEPVERGSSFKGLHVSRWDTPVEWRSYGQRGSNERWDTRRLPSTYEPRQKLEAKDIRVGDYLMVPRTFDATVPEESESFARLLGYYVAEGSVRTLSNERIGLQFSLHERERDTWATDIVGILAEHGVHATVVGGGKNRKAVQVTTTRHDGDAFCRKIVALGGRYSAKKRLAASVMTWPVSLKRAFLTGYMRGDGSVSERAEPTRSVTASCATVSADLADQLWLLFAQVGWPCARRVSHPHGKDGRARLPRHDFSVKGHWADDLIRTVYGRTPVRNAESNAKSMIWMDDDYVYYQIKSIEDIASDAPVYGLTVSGDHSYIASGLATYNSLFNAAIATARRRSSPLKVAKIGNDTFMPPPEYGDKVLRMITQSEMDVHSWLVMLNCVQFELVGVQEQVMSINAHYDLIERVKLSALGVSRALINGEANYSASAAGLTIFMQRLQAIRTMFVREWLIPKFFDVLAEAREWVKPTEAEVAHGVRVKRSHQEKLDRGMYIKPNIEWAKSLDSKVDADRANILAQLEQSGIVKFSSRTKYAAVGLDRDIEWRQIKQEAAEARKVAGDDPMVLDRLGYGAPAPEDGGMGGGGGGGAPATLPPLPPGSLGEFGPPADQAQPPPEQAAGVGVSATEDAEASDLAAAGWEADAISAGKRLLKTFDPADAQDTAPWDQVLDSPAVRAAVATGDARHAWNAIEAWLIGRAYPADVIISLEKALTSRTASSLSKIELEALAAIEAIEAEIGQDGDSSI